MSWTTKGIDLALLKQVKEVERGRVSATTRAGAAPPPAIVAGGSVWDVPADIALPCATQNELDAEAPRDSSATEC